MEEEYYENQLRTINDKFENLEKQFEKGEKCIVIQLGSRLTKFGWANTAVQQTIHTVVSFRNPNPIESTAEFNDPTIVRSPDFEDVYAAVVEDKKNLLSKQKKSKGQSKIPTPLIDDFILDDGKELLAANPIYFVGKMCANSNYITRFPLFKGNFNISPVYKEEQILNDLILIFEEVIFRQLGILPTGLKDYDLVLCLPDNFERKNFERLIDSVIKRFMFNGICLYYESVLACFANCVPIALWIDFGYTKTTLIGVEEGVQISETLTVADVGIRNILGFLADTLESKRGIRINEYDNGELLEKLITNFGAFTFDQKTTDEKIEEPQKLIKINLKNRMTNQIDEIIFSKDDFLLALNSVFYEQEGCGGATLDKAVFEFLSKISSEELKPKYLLSMVFTGGLAELKGFVSEFEDRLINRVVVENSPIEEVAVIDMSSRGIFKNEAVFQGACILPKLDCFNDILILTNTYLGIFKGDEKTDKRSLVGKHYLKEKVPFQW